MPEITESLEVLNERLKEHYGIDTESNRPMWRIVWSDDQVEKRYGTFEDYAGPIYLRTVTEVREVKKYTHINPPAHVLEHLVGVEGNPELLEKTSYEPIFTYQHLLTGKTLPPIWPVTKLVIDSVMLAMNHPNPFAKYKDNPREEAEKEFRKMYDYLYGDETNTTDALAYKEGVVVPNKQFGE
jgi:hypothetical protein